MLKLEKIYLIVLMCLFVYFLYSAFNTPMLGEDEGVYFKGIGKGSPVLIPALFSLTHSLPIDKCIITVFGILTVLVVYLIGRKISFFYGFISSFLLLSIPYFSHFSMIAYMEIPIAFFSALITYLVLNSKNTILTGIITGLSLFVKFSGIVFLPVFLILFLLKRERKYLYIFLIALAFMPFVSGIEYFFKPSIVPTWITEISSQIAVSYNFLSFTNFFGVVSIMFLIIGTVHIYFTKNNKFNFHLIFVFIFILAFFYLNLKVGADIRYFTIIFPQVALIGGWYIFELRKYKKIFFTMLIILMIYSFYTSISVVYATSNSVRYTEEYVNALKYIKNNTPKNSTVFTTYCGSVFYYAERDCLWTKVVEFPEIMRTDNITFIKETLRKYNVSHIVVWRPLVAKDIVVPESNLLGVFTYNFVNIAISNLNTPYQNTNVIIFEV